MLLKLEEFYKQINLQEGFFYKELEKYLFYQLKKQMVEREKEKTYMDSLYQQEERNSSLIVLSEEMMEVKEKLACKDLL